MHFVVYKQQMLKFEDKMVESKIHFLSHEMYRDCLSFLYVFCAEMLQNVTIFLNALLFYSRRRLLSVTVSDARLKFLYFVFRLVSFTRISFPL